MLLAPSPLRTTGPPPPPGPARNCPPPAPPPAGGNEYLRVLGASAGFAHEDGKGSGCQPRWAANRMPGLPRCHPTALHPQWACTACSQWPAALWPPAQPRPFHSTHTGALRCAPPAPYLAGHRGWRVGRRRGCQRAARRRGSAAARRTAAAAGARHRGWRALLRPAGARHRGCQGAGRHIAAAGAGLHRGPGREIVAKSIGLMALNSASSMQGGECMLAPWQGKATPPKYSSSAADLHSHRGCRRAGAPHTARRRRRSRPGRCRAGRHSLQGSGENITHH